MMTPYVIVGSRHRPSAKVCYVAICSTILPQLSIRSLACKAEYLNGASKECVFQSMNNACYYFNSSVLI